jgi:hypothetical protein
MGCSGVVAFPKYVEERFEGDHGRIVFDLDDFGVTGGVRANVVVARVFGVAAREADTCGGHAFDVAKRFLDSILSQGGSRKALDAFIDFRGRQPSLDALLKQSGIADRQ